MISDEAFDAAVDALVASRLGDHKGINGEEFVEAARAALEAAAPHLFASLAEQAWAEASENVPPSPTRYAWSDKCVAASDWLEAKAKASGWAPRG